MMKYGNVIYKEKRKLIDMLIYKLMKITIIAVNIILISFLISMIRLYNYGQYGVLRFILYNILFIFVIILLFIIFFRKDNYSFDIYELGFTYRNRMDGADRENNFLPFSEIENVKFSSYGLRCTITIKNGFSNIIDITNDPQAYTTLIKSLVNQLSLTKFPNLDIIVKYKDSINEEVLQIINGQLVNPEAYAYQQLMIINREFQ
jgi:hypothetical protein